MTCLVCNESKPIHAKGMCKNCYMKALRKKNVAPPQGNAASAKRGKIVNLRHSGLSFSEIGINLNCSKQNANQVYNCYLKNTMASRKPSRQWYEIYELTPKKRKIFRGVVTFRYELQKKLNENKCYFAIGVIDKKCYTTNDEGSVILNASYRNQTK